MDATIECSLHAVSADHLWLDKLESEPECGIDLHSLSLTRMEIFPTITKRRDKSREAPISGWGC